PFSVGRGFISRRIIKSIAFTTAAASHRPTRLQRVKPALWKTPLWGAFFSQTVIFWSPIGQNCRYFVIYQTNIAIRIQAN
ncbi:MAG: hypothetical protein IJD75_08070, partial [Clostridia bacterium]|nr:hypothetical protein [Clostridia bacterium]